MTARAEAIEETAARWVARRDAAAWGDAEQAALDAWLDTDMRHRTSFLRLASAWEAADAMRDAAPERAYVQRAGSRRWIAGGLGAALAAGIAAFALWGGPTRYETPIGGREVIGLADGSQAELNTHTTIADRYDARVRRLELRSGEAFFTVAHDRAHPFVVDAGRVRVIAVGTAFSVRRDEDRVRVLVAEGVVRVERSDGDGAPALVSNGAQARADGRGIAVTPLGTAAVAAGLEWRAGMLVFERTPLAEVANEFNRYNRAQITIHPALAARPIGGMFRATDPQAFARLMSADPAIASAMGADGAILLRPK